MKTLVVGLGNPLLGDDGVGWVVAAAVRRARPDVEVDCLALGGLSLMERLIGYERVVIIDAIATGRAAPGAVSRCALAALPDPSAGHTTAAHDTSLQTALSLGRRLGAALPSAIDVVGIEVARGYDFGERLSPAVAAAVAAAVDVVLAWLAGEEDCATRRLGQSWSQSQSQS